MSSLRLFLTCQEHSLVSKIVSKFWSSLGHTSQMTGHCSPLKHRRFPSINSKEWRHMCHLGLMKIQLYGPSNLLFGLVLPDVGLNDISLLASWG